AGVPSGANRGCPRAARGGGRGADAKCKEAGLAPASCFSNAVRSEPTIRMRVGEVGACGIGARWGRSIPQTRGLTPLGERHHQPPEPGLARREANHQKKRPNHHSKRRLLKRESQAAARKEGG